ncbi:MAG: putative O-glycosylation ligase, exosortase A system-associated [Pseudomonadota bacterium]
MRDLAFVAFLLTLIGFGFKRPFLFVLAYAYIDIVSPQRLTYLLLNSAPISLIAFALAFLGWAVADDKKGIGIAPRQILLIMLLLYCGYTTMHADFPDSAPNKWDWVWKALVFATFLPFTLRTRLRIESLLLFMVLSAASIIIVGGIKTLASGGGYGILNLMVTSNSGLYEGSTLAAVAVAIVPIILWLTKFGTIYPSDIRVKLFAAGLIFACLLIPVGTQARTGLICIGVLGILMLRHTKRRVLYISIVAAGLAIAIPFLPSSFTQRMDTIKGYKADSSASTRVAVWKWTWDYAKDHPMGGGFEAYRSNKLKIVKTEVDGSAANSDVTTVVEYDQSRAYHSAYFEMLGEQGWPGLILWLMIQIGGLFSMERLRWRTKKDPDREWMSMLAGALFQAHIIYLVGALFVGIAFQPFVYMLIGAQIGLSTYAARERKGEAAAGRSWASA